MVETARGAGLLLGVAQVFRFEESTARLRERVAAGADRQSCFRPIGILFSCRGGARRVPGFTIPP